MRYIKLAYILPFIFFACNGTDTEVRTGSSQRDAQLPPVNVPNFNADSAYYFVERQVAFGPRVPGTREHEMTLQYLVSVLQQYADTVEVQTGRATIYDGRVMPIRNIIARFNPESPKQILLCAHWDTRPYADQDEEGQNQPILGANDGASGVGVLLEMARLFHHQRPEAGVLMVFFDLEDWGQPVHKPQGPHHHDSYALGAQHWARNLNKTQHIADYGILLDMVGAEDARFMFEGYSMRFNPSLVRRVWNRAQQLGYGNYFIQRETHPVTDDHYYVNTIAQIPTINIIDFDHSRDKGFHDSWHTHEDNMDIISRRTLKAVGQTVTHIVYEERVPQMASEAAN